MKLATALLFLATLLAPGTARAAGYYDVSDDAMGVYDGFWTAANGARGRMSAHLRPLGNNRYDGFILLFRSRSPVTALNIESSPFENGKVAFKASASTKEQGGDLLAKLEANGTVADAKLAGTFKGDLGDGKFEATKSQLHPSSLGAKPPANAIVLFDGKPGEAWDNFSWPVQDGILQVGKGNLRTNKKLKNYRLHLEFRTPYMPAAQGQARGNSGVYLQGKYEVQVLDSFGIFPLHDNDCSGIYKTRAPAVNACLPPMAWQTYDIDFSSDGPTITVLHNGLITIKDAKIPANLVENGTGGGDPNAGFLMLQDHGNPVQYRNIWAIPLD